MHGGYYDEDKEKYGFSDDSEYRYVVMTQKMIESDLLYPYMDGQEVFKTAVRKFPEVIIEALKSTGYSAMILN